LTSSVSIESPPRPAHRASFEPGVEGLRGFAALAVLHCHLSFPAPQVDPAYAPPAAGYTFQAGQGAVLLFFVISGYVIGLAHPETFSAANLMEYAKRRVLRIYPLYLLAVLAGAWAIHEATAWPVVANLLMLQTPLPFFGATAPLLQGNGNLWSLQYEMVYYGLFVVLWCGRISPLVPMGASLAIVAAGWLLPGWPPLLVNYAAGWVFWLAGLWLARVPAAADAPRLPWPSLLLLFLATWNMKPLTLILARLGCVPPVEGWINLTNVEFLPVCFALLLAVGTRRPPGWRWMVAAAYVPSLLICAWQAQRGALFQDYLAPYEIAALAALALAWWRPSAAWWRRLAPVGAISYGIYAFQRPVQLGVLGQDWLPAGNGLTYALRVLVIAGATAGVAWLDERQLQPWLRRRFLTARA
jgi:peptidoglycan/LPS O-acetylase OafA/YrhL